MKKSFSFFKGAAFNKLGFLPFLMTFLFLAGMQVDMKAQVQHTNAVNPAQAGLNPAREMYLLPTGAFVNSATAQTRLLNAMKLLKDQLAQYAEGTAPYDAAFLRYTYYQYIMANLEAGKGVPESIVGGINMLTTDLKFHVTPQQAVVEKNAAIALLRP
jgi:hypothetical protein